MRRTAAGACRMSRFIACAVIFVGASFGLAHGRAADDFTITDAMIPARDGVKLHVKLYAPKKQNDPLPIILLRTPYNADRGGRHFASYFKALAEDGYIFAFADIRGKYKSEGDFVMQ